MRLNPDCIRDIILFIEENTDSRKGVNAKQLIESYPNYTEDVLEYHVNYLKDAYLIQGVSKYMGGGYSIRDLTPQGHEFAQNIHNDTNWNKVKESAKAVGSFSIDTLQKIAVNVISTAINATIIK